VIPSTETTETAGGTAVAVKFELPEPVVEEIRDQHGGLDRDAVSDRILAVPLVDGEAV
jgi:hypothetical protein